jgi:predicted DNA-binding antitoxin AbrB/MazE fold protein
METITAIYENGVFKPLHQVHLPEGTQVRVETGNPQADLRADISKQLLADGATPEEATRILDNLSLLWDSYNSLTEQQKESLEGTRLDQVKFFDRSSGGPTKP